jgi:hypothetical protein
MALVFLNYSEKALTVAQKEQVKEQFPGRSIDFRDIEVIIEKNVALPIQVVDLMEQANLDRGDEIILLLPDNGPVAALLVHMLTYDPHLYHVWIARLIPISEGKRTRYNLKEWILLERK